MESDSQGINSNTILKLKKIPCIWCEMMLETFGWETQGERACVTSSELLLINWYINKGEVWKEVGQIIYGIQLHISSALVFSRESSRRMYNNSWFQTASIYLIMHLLNTFFF